jgi:hypothetical protein
MLHLKSQIPISTILPSNSTRLHKATEAAAPREVQQIRLSSVSQPWLWQEVLGGITARALPRPHGIEITPLRLGKLSGLDMFHTGLQPSYTFEDIISSPGHSRASSPQLESTTTTSSGPEGSQPAVKTTGVRSWLKSAVWQALR